MISTSLRNHISFPSSLRDTALHYPQDLASSHRPERMLLPWKRNARWLATCIRDCQSSTTLLLSDMMSFLEMRTRKSLEICNHYYMIILQPLFFFLTEASWVCCTPNKTDIHCLGTCKMTYDCRNKLHIEFWSGSLPLFDAKYYGIHLLSCFSFLSFH